MKEFILVRDGFLIGSVGVNYESTDTDEVPRYVENPEWRVKNLEEQINIIGTRDGYYDKQIDNILILKDKLEEQKKELKKELKKLRTSTE